MTTATRTGRSIKNGQIAMIYYIVNMLLGFYSRKIFIDYVGIDVLGLNQTAQNLLGFLNIAELGIGSAVAFSLYRPVAHQDITSINEIIALQGWLYRRIAYFIGGGAVIMMFFFPMIFKDIKLPLWYAYSSFGVFLYSSLLTYFVNYKQIIFSASQLEYKITLNYNFTLLYKTVLQILALQFLPDPYVWWLVLQVAGATAASWRLNRAIKKAYPYLNSTARQGKGLVKKYSIIVTKIKQVFFQSISGFALSQSSSLLIFAFVDLKMVAIYSNYMLIANCLRMIFNSAFTGITSGVGNLIAEDDKEKCMKIFEELFSAKFLLIITLLATFYIAVNPFMTIWLGEGLYLKKSTIIIIVATLYIILSETTTGSFKQALGLYQDIWAPIAETILNIGLSILLGYHWGINGVLSGVLISLILMISGWKPYFVFHYGLKISYLRYVKMYLRHIIAFAVSISLVFSLWKLFDFNPPTNYFSWGLMYLFFATLLFTVLAITLYLITPGMKKFSIRLRMMILKK